MLHSSCLSENVQFKRVKKILMGMEDVVLHPKEQGRHLYVLLDLSILPTDTHKQKALLDEYLRLYTSNVQVRFKYRWSYSVSPSPACLSFMSHNECMHRWCPQLKQKLSKKEESAVLSGFECGLQFAASLGDVADVVRRV